jgi:hypothetical protein
MKNTSHFAPPRTNLPILQYLLNAYKQWYEIAQHLPKGSRYTLGTKIDMLFTDTLELIYMAGMMPREKKVLYLEKAIRRFDVLKFFFRVAWEIRALDNKKYIAISSQLNDIGKMLGGWFRNVSQ